MSSYAALLRRPGAVRAATASGGAWWAFSGYGLALVLAVQHATGSFVVAGGATAAFATGSAALAPVRGRAVDRLGRQALVALVAFHTGFLVALVAACAEHQPPAWLLIASAGWVFDAYEGQIFNLTRNHLLGDLLKSAEQDVLYGLVAPFFKTKWATPADAIPFFGSHRPNSLARWTSRAAR